MGETERIADLVRRSADLIPAPPREHDAFGYLAWEELVHDTAYRISQLADHRLPELLRWCDASSPEIGPSVSWQDLVRLAAAMSAQTRRPGAAADGPAADHSGRGSLDRQSAHLPFSTASGAHAIQLARPGPREG